MSEIYVIGYFNEDGTLGHYVRKGRNYSVSAYDNLESAKRGLSQSRRGKAEKYKNLYKLINFKNGLVLEE